MAELEWSGADQAAFAAGDFAHLFQRDFTANCVAQDAVLLLLLLHFGPFWLSGWVNVVNILVKRYC